MNSPGWIAGPPLRYTDHISKTAYTALLYNLFMYLAPFSGCQLDEVGDSVLIILVSSAFSTVLFNNSHGINVS